MKNAHQPYFFNNKLYHCKKGELISHQLWIPYVGSKRIVELSKFVSVCSLVPNERGLSFIGGRFKGNLIEYKLYYWDYSINKIVDMGKKEYGFCKPNFLFDLNIDFKITRVVPVEIDEPWLLLTKPSKTFVYDFIKNQIIGTLKVYGKDVYKCCLSEIGCHYAHKSGDDFEDREILFSSEWSLD